LMRTNHYEAGITLSALHEIHKEWHLLEWRILVIRETGWRCLSLPRRNALSEIPRSGLFQRWQSVATCLCLNLN
jgi:hypothetical protein